MVWCPNVRTEFQQDFEIFIFDRSENFEGQNDLNCYDKPKISISDYSHLRIGAKASATIQFRQKVAPKTPPKVENYYLLKMSKKQFFHLILGLTGR